MGGQLGVPGVLVALPVVEEHNLKQEHALTQLLLALGLPVAVFHLKAKVVILVAALWQVGGQHSAPAARLAVMEAKVELALIQLHHVEEPTV